ncbi:MAG: hypothetical protein ACYDER_11050 [Ktedonobacteraceae bacterium]
MPYKDEEQRKADNKKRYEKLKRDPERHAKKLAYDRKYRMEARQNPEKYQQLREQEKTCYQRLYSPTGEKREEYLEKARVRRRNYREVRQEKRTQERQDMVSYYRQYKASLRCMKCGENDPACLNFHHRNKHEKTHNVSYYIYLYPNLKKFMQEVEKCDVLCANCHFIEHWQERDENADIFEYQRLQEQFANTKGWLARKKIREKFERLETIIWLYRYKRTIVCELCGANHPACLQFHHVDRNNKLGEVGNLASGSNIKKLMREINRCQVLCANCHSKLHWGGSYA